MSVLSLLLTLILIGVITWASTTYIPMSEGIAKVIKVAAIILAVVITIKFFGLTLAFF